MQKKVFDQDHIPFLNIAIMCIFGTPELCFSNFAVLTDAYDGCGVLILTVFMDEPYGEIL